MFVDHDWAPATPGVLIERDVAATRRDLSRLYKAEALDQSHGSSNRRLQPLNCPIHVLLGYDCRYYDVTYPKTEASCLERLFTCTAPLFWPHIKATTILMLLTSLNILDLLPSGV